MFGLGKILQLLIELLAQSRRNGELLREIKQILKLREPGLVFLKLVSQRENGVFTFVLNLPPAGASDVATRKLSVSIGGADPTGFELSADAVVSAELVGELNDTVEGSLVDVDASGNESPARAFSFVITDTVPPPQPGEVAIAIVRQD